MIGLQNKPYLDYSEYVDTDYLHKNREKVITGIANCGLQTWKMTGGFCNLLETIDEKHHKLRHHRGVEYDFSNVRDHQMFEQLYFELYNVGHYRVLKENYNYTSAFDEHFIFMEDFFSSLPFTRIREILLMVQPAGTETLVHRDPAHLNPDRFIYIRPDLHKPFFIYDEDTNEKHYVNSLAAEWSWDDWHGADQIPYAAYAFKVKGDLDL